MKNVIFAWLAVLVVLAVIAVSCSINHVTGEYECDTTADCTNNGLAGRVCSDGLCVVPGGPKMDAAVDSPTTDGSTDASGCPAQCTSCNLSKKECTINCAIAPGGCQNAVVCPAGFNCIVQCGPQNSCRNGINCLMTLSCVIDCTGSGSCRNLACGPGPCDVNCAGNGSCRGVACGQSCACDVTCGGLADCTTVTCTAPQCRDFLTGGCSSMFNGCDTCP